MIRWRCKISRHEERKGGDHNGGPINGKFERWDILRQSAHGGWTSIAARSCPSELGAEKQRSILTLLRDRNLGLPTDFEDPGDDFGGISALLGTECWSFTDPWSIIGNWQRQTLQKADVTSPEPLE